MKRLQRLGAQEKIWREVYILFIQSILEFAAPVWTGALTANKKLSGTLDMIQNCTCRVVKPELSSVEAQSVLKITAFGGEKDKYLKKLYILWSFSPMVP